MKTKYVYTGFIGFFFSLYTVSCKTTIELAIPSQFSDNATKMPAKGLGKKYMSFGNYQTSKIKRGWNPGSSRRMGSFGRRFIEDRLLIDFGITANNIRAKEKGKFQYEISNGNSWAAIYAREQKETNNLRIKTNTGLDVFNNMDLLKNYEYSFPATIFPGNSKYKEPWKLFISNSYNAFTDTSRKLFEMPTGNEHGYATDGKDSIFIKAIFVKKSENAKGKEVKMPVKMLGGYELSWEGGVVCVVDAIKKNVWMYNDLQEHEKFILAAISSAIMLRRVQDIRR
jgi:hypothetical protein